MPLRLEPSRPNEAYYEANTVQSVRLHHSDELQTGSSGGLALMATDNVNQSGASAAADSAKETVAPVESTGPNSAAVEPQAAADSTNSAPSDTAAGAASSETATASTQEETNAACSWGSKRLQRSAACKVWVETCSST